MPGSWSEQHSEMQKADGQSKWQSGGILRTRNQRESSLFRLSSAAILADTGRHLSLLWRRWSGRNFSSLESWSDDMQPSSKERSLCIWGLGRFRGRVNRRLEPVWVWVAQEVGLCGRDLLPSTLCTGHVFPQVIRRRGVIFTLVAFIWTYVSFDSLDPTPRCVWEESCHHCALLRPPEVFWPTRDSRAGESQSSDKLGSCGSRMYNVSAWRWVRGFRRGPTRLFYNSGTFSLQTTECASKISVGFDLHMLQGRDKCFFFLLRNLLKNLHIDNWLGSGNVHIDNCIDNPKLL